MPFRWMIASGLLLSRRSSDAREQGSRATVDGRDSEISRSFGNTAGRKKEQHGVDERKRCRRGEQLPAATPFQGRRNDSPPMTQSTGTVASA